MNENHPRYQKVAVIGAGISGLSCATQLKKLGHVVEVFEKSRGPGGRMSTRHADDWSADHGAQYFTARNPIFIEEIRSWVKNGAASVWEPKLSVYEDGQWRQTNNKEIRYVGTPKMSSPGKLLAQNLSIQYQQTVNSIQKKGNKWSINSLESGAITKEFDWVIIALPATQAGNLTYLLSEQIKDITNSAGMKGCWTLIARFREKPSVQFDAAFINNEIISWICKNNSKPGRKGLESWTIHANPAWSQEKIEADQETVTKLITSCAQKLGLDCNNADLSIHRWRYANGHIPASPEFYIDPDLNLGICGDWLHGGRVEGAWLSGYKLANKIDSFI